MSSADPDAIETCSACGAAIRWVATRKGKCQPIDAEPDPAGNLRFVEGDRYRATIRGALRAIEVIPKAEREAEQLIPDGRDRYMPHHATCPKAEQFRSKPKGAA